MNALQRWPLTWADLQQSSSLPADRLQTLRQNVRLLLVSDQLQIPRAVGIVENNGPEAVVYQHQEFDFAERHTVGQRIREALAAELLAVYADHAHVRRQPSLVAGHAGNDAADLPLRAERQPKRIASRNESRFVLLEVVEIRGRFAGILKPVAAAADQVEGQSLQRCRHSPAKELCAVAFNQLLQNPYNLRA